MSSFHADEKTRFTAQDSLACKYSAARFKYFEDPFIECVYERVSETKGVGSAKVRRSPIIHRGYFARYESFSKVLGQFLDSTKGLSCSNHRQILILGPGFDTTSLLPYAQQQSNVRTFEVDFPEIIQKKVQVYKSIPEIKTLLEGYGTSSSVESDSKDSQGSSPGSTTIGPISFLERDLREAKQLISHLLSAGFDPTAPTLILTECVLVYMGREDVLSLSAELAAFLQGEAIWLTYDMINPSDMYGKSMVRNLQSAGFRIPGISDFSTTEHHRHRCLETGWLEARSCDMRFYYDKLIDDKIKEKLLKLEIMDEVEEWNMLMAHYSLTVAAKGSTLLQLLDIVPITAVVPEQSTSSSSS